jgi:peptide/nickel transport system substrate-binding protein
LHAFLLLTYFLGVYDDRVPKFRRKKGRLKLKRRWSAVALQLGVLSVALSPALAVGDEVTRGGTLFYQIGAEQRVLNPALRASNGVYEITGKIVEPLIDRTYDGYVGVLATDWSSSKDGRAQSVDHRRVGPRLA